MVLKMAERVGFEPTDARASPVFKTGSLNRSDISPNRFQAQSLCYHGMLILSTVIFDLSGTTTEKAGKYLFLT